MDPIEKLDRRIQRRLLAQRKITPADLEKAASKLPDLTENAARAEEEELEKLGNDLTAEREVRGERIQRALERAAAAEPERPTPPVTPIEESDL